MGRSGPWFAVSIVLVLQGAQSLPLADPVTNYVEARGAFLVGSPLSETGDVAATNRTINSASYPFSTQDCHRELHIHLSFEPEGVAADVEGVGEVAAGFEFEMRLRDAATGTLLPNGTLEWQAPGVRVHPLAGPRELVADLVLRRGWDVTYDLRIDGWLIPEAECAWQGQAFIAEIEANPAGTDAGNESVEILNHGAAELDLAGWRIEARHGVPATFEFPVLVLPIGGRTVVTFGSQFLDNEDETVVLVSPGGWDVDVSPTLSDQANDARSWQRVPDWEADWAFQTSTLGDPNV